MPGALSLFVGVGVGVTQLLASVLISACLFAPGRMS